MTALLRRLSALLDTPARRALRRLVALTAAQAVLSGLAFAVLVPGLQALVAGDLGRVWGWVWVLVGVVAAHHLTLALATSTTATLESSLLEAVLRRSGEQLLRAPLGWFDTDRTGQVVQLVTKDALSLSALLTAGVRPLVTAVGTPLTVAAVMLAWRWQLGLALVLGAALVVGLTRVMTRRVAAADRQRHEGSEQASARVVEFAVQQPVLRVFGRTTGGNRLLEDALRSQHRSQRAMTLTGFAGSSYAVTAVQVVLTVVVAMSVGYALDGELAPATAVALSVLALRFVEPFVEGLDAAAAVSLGHRALDRLDAVLSAPVLPEPEHPALPTGSVDVVLEQVTFGYGGPAPSASVLHEVDLMAAPASLTAVVGPSGSGKSTLLRLVARAWDTGSGSVRLGGVDVRELGSEQVRQLVSVVAQDAYLFEGTLRSNVAMSRSSATDAELEEVAALAGLGDLLRRLPDGWLTRVGEGGSTLSGGERQRLSLARALLQRAPVVLLDEATASLDALTEVAVQRTVAALATTCTVIVVAHHLATVAAADAIVVLDEGRVVQRGRHEDLLAEPGVYRRFWEQRVAAQGWRLART